MNRFTQQLDDLMDTFAFQGGPTILAVDECIGAGETGFFLSCVVFRDTIDPKKENIYAWFNTLVDLLAWMTDEEIDAFIAAFKPTYTNGE
jgi:hypothetical protein